MSDDLDIVIAGGGIGGLSAAIALSRCGHEVSVIEKAPAMGWGQGVQVSPAGMAALHALGLADRVRDTGQVMKGARKLTRQGLVLRERAFGRVKGVNQPHVAISRGSLQLLLAEEAQRLEIPLSLDSSVTEFDENPGGLELQIEQGDSRQLRQCDLLIGADGIHSVVRASLFPGDQPVYTGFIQYRAVVPAGSVNTALEPGLVTVYGDARRFYSYYLMNDEEVSFGACVQVGEDQAPEESWSTQGEASELAGQFAGFDGPLKELAENTPYLARMHIFDHATLPHWSGDRVSLLGDAAHAMLPFAGQATVTAIEDAMSLAGWLGQGLALPEALAGYQDERIPPVARIRDHCRDRGGVFEEYLVAEEICDAAWQALDPEEQQRRLAAIDWSRHDSFLRNLY